MSIHVISAVIVVQASPSGLLVSYAFLTVYYNRIGYCNSSNYSLSPPSQKKPAKGTCDFGGVFSKQRCTLGSFLGGGAQTFCMALYINSQLFYQSVASSYILLVNYPIVVLNSIAMAGRCDPNSETEQQPQLRYDV